MPPSDKVTFMAVAAITHPWNTNLTFFSFSKNTPLQPVSSLTVDYGTDRVTLSEEVV